jgi:hypothetical protein
MQPSKCHVCGVDINTGINGHRIYCDVCAKKAEAELKRAAKVRYEIKQRDIKNKSKTGVNPSMKCPDNVSTEDWFCATWPVLMEDARKKWLHEIT